MPSAMMKKKAAAGRGGPTVTGTDADLRRLSMEAAREVCHFLNIFIKLIKLFHKGAHVFSKHVKVLTDRKLKNKNDPVAILAMFWSHYILQYPT